VAIDDDPSSYLLSVAMGHGGFVFINQLNCTATGQCTPVVAALYRPDQAEDPYVAKRYLYMPDQSYCMDDQQSYLPNLNTAYDGYFENRDPVVFHGISCFKFSNSSEPYSLFADDNLGIIYGERQDGIDYIMNYTTASFTPQNFVFDPSQQPSCAATAYKIPNQQVWDTACDAPASSSSSFWKA